MANRLKMAKIHSIQTLRAQGWSQRRIARALNVDRETVARYVRAADDRQNQPNLPIGSGGMDEAPGPGVAGLRESAGPPGSDQNQPSLPTGTDGFDGLPRDVLAELDDDIRRGSAASG